MDATVLLHSCLLLIIMLTRFASSDVVALNSANIGSVIGSNELVFINFYADWCRFSQILAPVFEEASNKIKEDNFATGKVSFAKVDCDQESDIAQQYHISKYPTLKLVRNGQLIKKEYRGQRSSDALAQYIKDQVKDTIKQHSSLDSISEITDSKHNVIGYFADVNSDSYRVFTKVASTLREECEFHSAVGDASQPETSNGDKVMFRAPNTHGEDEAYDGTLTDFDTLLQWVTQKCVPLVREITFENAEELTEEGLPFLILFHHPDDKNIKERFTKAVQEQLLSEKTAINFLVADGVKFKHPLHHLGKSESDLPVLAIDSFRHMYLFPHNTKEDLEFRDFLDSGWPTIQTPPGSFRKSPSDLPVLAIDSFRHMYLFPYSTQEDIEKPGILKQFVADLHSGKLHREFHHGPDPTTPYPTPPPPESMNKEEQAKTEHIPHDTNNDKPKHPTSPPESTFRKLAPSRNRYTILKDEL